MTFEIRPKAAIFDLDGTLADTFDLVITSFASACREHLGRDLTRDEVVSRFGVTEVQMLRRELPCELHERAIDHFRRCYRENHPRMVRVFPGIQEMLDALRAKKIPLAIMTGKGRDTCDITLEQLGWTQLFDSVITGDECRSPKPAPDGVLLAAKQLGVSARECLFIGDAPADIAAGKAAGMTTVWASWHPIYREQIEKLRPDIIANEPGDVAGLFE